MTIQRVRVVATKTDWRNQRFHEMEQDVTSENNALCKSLAKIGFFHPGSSVSRWMSLVPGKLITKNVEAAITKVMQQRGWVPAQEKRLLRRGTKGWSKDLGGTIVTIEYAPGGAMMYGIPLTGVYT